MTVTEAQFKVAAKKLFALALENHGASKKAANFILSWCNAYGFGGFDFTELWGLDEENQRAVFVVIIFLTTQHSYFEQYGFRRDVNKVIRKWRGHLLNDEARRFMEWQEQREEHQ